MWTELFADRVDAGRRLAQQLEYLRGEDLVVLGLPRGGVPVASEVAEALGAPLDVIVVRKLGVPFQPELAMGAIGEDGVRIINREVLATARVTEDDLAAVEDRERAELEQRARRFRGSRRPTPLTGRTAVVVDDGIATGATARAACRIARAHGAARVVLAVPVAPPGWTASFRHDADDLVCLETPPGFYAIGQWYRDFSPTSEEEVVRCLQKRVSRATGGEKAEPIERDEEVEIAARSVSLAGHLTVPRGAPGIVIFAHGSGSSRHSSRNRFVAGVLNDAGLGTLLFDLLTVSEESDRSNVFDIELLADRLIEVTRWLVAQPEARDTRVGYFGASTGAAAALWAAARIDIDVAAVVSRGGRPDLAAPHLAAVTAPTLLIVGGHDDAVLDLNRKAQARLTCANRLAVVPGAGHLFEEPGTLEGAAELARDWFVGHLFPVAGRAPEPPGDDRWRGASLERAREEAAGVELYEEPFTDEALLVEREAVQGVDLFVDPDSVIPAKALREGSSGHETLAGDQAGLGRDAEDETRERTDEESRNG